MAVRLPRSRVVSCVASLLVLVACLNTTVLGADQPAAHLERTPRPRNGRADRTSVMAERQAIFEAEDRRAPTAADVAVLVKGTRSGQEAVQRAAVRALGRLERPSLVLDIVPLLSAPWSSVRAETANALGQIAASVDQVHQCDIPALLMTRLYTERNADVRGVLCQTIGRLPYSSARDVGRAEAVLLEASDPAAGANAPVPLPVLHGVIKGFESLIRRNVKIVPPTADTVTRLRGWVIGQRHEPGLAAVEISARIRRLALVALTSASQVDQDTIAAAVGDPDVQVRRLAISALATAPPAVVPDEARMRLIRGGLADRNHMVRFEALRLHGRSLAAATADWGPVFAALSDPSLHVALLAIDLLGNAQAGSIAATDRLRIEAATLASPRTGTTGTTDTTTDGAVASSTRWHRAVHALVSLAKVAPITAADMLPAFVASPLWPVRMYAARAATVIRDEAVLRQLVEDPHDNVRETALSGLQTKRGHDGDAIYIAALRRPDYQVILTATRALETSPQPAHAVPALLAALARITAERRDTSRDPRLALLARVGELGQAGDAPALMPYTYDFDPQVAATAAAIIGRWTGKEPIVSPRPLPIETPQLADVERLRSARVIVTMARRGVFELAVVY